MRPGATLLAVLWAFETPAAAQRAPFDPAGDIRFDQRLGSSLPLERRFLDEAGRAVELGELFQDRPVVLALVYYECPMLCTLVLNGLASAVQTLDLVPGRDFQVVAVSIDPAETPALAAAKKQALLRTLPEASRDGWRFLVGEEPAIRAVADAVGFRYVADPATGGFAHAAGVVILTPQAQVSRYLFGVEFAPRDLGLSLVEASAGRVGDLVDRVLLLCLHWDPETGRYGLAILTAVRMGGGLTVALLAGAIFLFLRRERRSAPLRRGAGGP